MNPVGKSELAQLAGVSPATITKAIKTGRLFETVEGRVDLDAASTVAFLKATEARKRLAPPSPAARAPGGGRSVSAEIDQFQDAERRLKLEIMKQNALGKQIKNAKEIGTVVMRDHLMRGIVDPIQTAFVRLLSDCAKSMAGLIVPQVKAGAGEPEIEELISKEHSIVLKSLKKQMSRALREAEKQPA